MTLNSEQNSDENYILPVCSTFSVHITLIFLLLTVLWIKLHIASVGLLCPFLLSTSVMEFLSLYSNCVCRYSQNWLGQKQFRDGKTNFNAGLLTSGQSKPIPPEHFSAVGWATFGAQCSTDWTSGIVFKVKYCSYLCSCASLVTPSKAWLPWVIRNRSWPSVQKEAIKKRSHGSQWGFPLSKDYVFSRKLM